MIKDIFVEMSIQDGIKFVSQGKEEKLFYENNRLSTASGSALFVEQKENLVCTCCSLKANTWIAYKERNQPPVLNLYHKDNIGNVKLFTRDHIIPKALGGVDHINNLRVMCETCNSNRSCTLNENEMQFYLDNINSLICHERIHTSVNRLLNGLSKKKYSCNDAISLINNIQGVFDFLKANGALNGEFIKHQKNLHSLMPIYEIAAKAENELKAIRIAREDKKRQKWLEENSLQEEQA